MTINKKLIIILVIIIIIVLFVFGFLFFMKNKKQEIQIPIEENKTQPMTEVKKENFNSLEFEKQAKIDENSQIITTARNFIERYGSWSNHTENFYELISPMITDRMYNQAKNYISNNPNFLDDKNFYGITTKLLNAEILESSTNSAKVSLQLQQTESKNGTENTFYKQAELSLIFTNNEWLVDSVTWK
jgi:hypothetical protein